MNSIHFLWFYISNLCPKHQVKEILKTNCMHHFLFQKCQIFAVNNNACHSLIPITTNAEIHD